MHLAAFRGGWRIARRITDARSGGTGRFVGRARFVGAGEGLEYTEEGTLRLDGGGALTAARRYRWREEGGAILVAFDDGRPFHRFDCDAQRPEAEHDCLPDRYRVRYDFGHWPVWTAVWRVSGPRKGYVSVTRYALDSGTPAGDRLRTGTCPAPESGVPVARRDLPLVKERTAAS
jgi:hypothetical protein